MATRQPISMLPTLSSHIDGVLEAAQEQYATLLEAKPVREERGRWKMASLVE